MSDTPMNRREVLASAAALGGLALAGSGAMGATAHADGAADAKELGWDADKGEFVLPALPYGYDALEPHIDEQTMRIHHGKHHAGYVRGANGALKALAGLRDGEVDAGLIQNWSRKLSFHLGGHMNHTLFWRGLAPAGKGGGGRPTGALASAIDRDFGSFDKFRAHFSGAAGAVEGSGWAWLVHHGISGRLLVLQMENQQKLLPVGVTALLGVDVWEHAYYLRYQNRRKDYVRAFFEVIDWGRVGARFSGA